MVVLQCDVVCIYILKHLLSNIKLYTYNFTSRERGHYGSGFTDISVSRSPEHALFLFQVECRFQLRTFLTLDP